jgi:hypothetical protein
MRRFMSKNTSFKQNVTPQVKLFEFKTCTDSLYLVLNFYEINGDDEI